MPNYILETKFNINGRRIRCKVTGAPGSAHDGAPYILEIRGGPGQLLSTRLSDFFDHHYEGSPAPHFILFDVLGSGESDHAENPDVEYSVENFTHIAASIVEDVAKQLQIQKMNLRVTGGSFGGLIALNIPRHKPEWTATDSPIRLQAIFANVAILGMKDCMTKEFLATHYAGDPRLPQYNRAVDRLIAGDFKNQNDYISGYVVPIARTMGDAYNTFFLRTCLNILEKYPHSFYYLLSALKHIKPFRAFAENNFDWLYRFSYEVLNYFWRNKFHDFELEDKIRENPDLAEAYSKIVIFSVYGVNDVCTAGEKSLNRLHDLLPGMGSLLRPGKHHDYADACNHLLKSFFSGDIVKFEAALRDVTTENNIVTIPASFREHFIASYQETAQSSSTSAVLSALDDGARRDSRQSIQAPNLQIEPVISRQAEKMTVLPATGGPFIMVDANEHIYPAGGIWP